MNSEEVIAFVREHKDEDPLKLLLQQEKYPDVDMNMAAQQIEGRKQASAKWPTLAGCERFLYPPRLNREQSSSEAAALNKARILSELAEKNTKALTVADLTGGMGIDSMAFAHLPDSQVAYVENNAELCRLMEHNAKAMGLDNISVHCGDSMEWLQQTGNHHDLIFIDPARRDIKGRKVAAFEDCSPNIMGHLTLLSKKCSWLMVKASPMMDIDKGIGQLGNVSDVYVVAVNGECKELLFLCKNGGDEPLIHCQNIIPGESTCCDVSFTRSQEANANAKYCTSVGRYIYEPDASLMKGGPFKLLSDKWGLQKLSHNTHLYTSDQSLEWSGRTFCVLREIQLNRKNVAAAIPDGKAHVVTRNYPVEAATLQHQLGLKEGGDLFIIATTVGNRKTGFICSLPEKY